MTIAVNDLIAQAGEILQDTKNARWAISELEDWINEAQRTIANQVDDANIGRSTLTATAGSKQVLTALASSANVIRLLDVIQETDSNRALVRGDKKLLDSLRPLWRAEATAVAEMWFYDENEPLVFEVYPPQAGTETLEVSYSAVPTAVSDGGDLSIGDQYAPAVLEYVLYRAFSKDTETVASDMGRAGAHFGAFANLIGMKTNMDQYARPEPRI